ncbi:MAG: YggT family protein [bacterium]|nr:YggT family protein [bacterium]
MLKALLIQGINLFFQILFWILIARILLTWFPNINWYDQPFKTLKEITDPILEPFRKFIPPIGGLDFSPIFAFLALYVINYVLVLLIAYI